jgi:hypothetical protein
VTTAVIHPNVIAGETPTLSPVVPASPSDLDKQHELGPFPRACLKTNQKSRHENRHTKN